MRRTSLSTAVRFTLNRVLFLVGWAVLVMRRSTDVVGVRMMISDPAVDRIRCTAKLDDALQLLAAVDPNALRRVQQRVRHVLVWPGDYTAYDVWGGVHLASSHLMSARPAILAGMLVHEATHLRIAACGIPYAPEVRARIEEACVRQEAAFLRKVPEGGEEAAASTMESLQMPWWGEDERYQRIHRSGTDSGRPAWLSDLIFRLGEGDRPHLRKKRGRRSPQM
jgi:hypothetical protein